jgi:TM2 domain-containing membrane protein YozV
MNCANHPDTAAAAYCRTCGKPLCVACKREAQGTIFCADHVPVAQVPYSSGGNATAPYSDPSFGTAQDATRLGAVPPETTSAYSSPYTAPYTNPAATSAAQPNSGPVPALAFVLGFIPGVGAIYNGQYAKGLIHAVIFGVLVSVIDRHPNGLEPLIGILMAAWIFYMAFEAYHTAKNRREGKQSEDLSSIVQIDCHSGRFPVTALILIGIGGLLLLDTTNLISIDRLFHLWPVGLILIGAYMLYERMGSAARVMPPSQTGEVRDEPR